MNAIRVYDWPTRLFHWLFAGFFVTAFAIANLVDDDSARFSLHMLAGLGMVFVVVLRLAWSTIGTRHARLGDLTLAPRQLGAYLKGLSLKEIAAARGTSEKTARVQSGAVYAKSGLAGRSELSAFFLEDLLPPGTGTDSVP